MDLIVLSESFGAFMNVSGSFLKLEGFSKLDFNTGGESYTRKYFSGDAICVDIADTAAEISYTFDRMKNNKVHDEIALISDLGKSGKSCIKEIVLVDFSKENEGNFEAVKQCFAIKCADKRPENGFLDYSGKMLATGEKSLGYVTLNDDNSLQFTEKRRGVLCDSNS